MRAPPGYSSAPARTLSSALPPALAAAPVLNEPGEERQRHGRDGARSSLSVGRIARGSVTAFVVFAAGIGLTYGSQLLIARLVGAEVYGIYAYVLAWMVVLAYGSALGFDVALLRFVPAYLVENDGARLWGVVQYAERRAMLAGFLVLLVGIGVNSVAVRASPSELKNTFYIGFILVPVWALLWIRCSVIRAFGGVVWALVPDRMVRDGMLLALVALVSFGLGVKLDAQLVMTATVISSAMGLGLASLARRRLWPSSGQQVKPAYVASLWRRTALPLVIIAAGEVLINRSGVILLGCMGDTKGAGIYGLAFNIAFLVALPRTAINTLFAPAISSLFARKEHSMLQVLVNRAACWTSCGAACIALGLALFAQPLLAWFGPEYTAGVPALRILLIGQVIAATGGSQLYVLTMTGHERSAALLLMFSTLANAVIGLVCVSLLGLLGAAIATATVLVLWNAGMAVFIWRHLQLLPGLLAVLQSMLGRHAVTDAGG